MVASRVLQAGSPYRHRCCGGGDGHGSQVAPLFRPRHPALALPILVLPVTPRLRARSVDPRIASSPSHRHHQPRRVQTLPDPPCRCHPAVKSARRLHRLPLGGQLPKVRGKSEGRLSSWPIYPTPLGTRFVQCSRGRFRREKSLDCIEGIAQRCSISWTNFQFTRGIYSLDSRQ